MPKPNQQEELLGLTVLDEPCLNQSKKAVLIKKLAEENYIDVHTNAIVESVRNADKNPKEIMNWINDISKLQKTKQLPTVSYSRQMPDIDTLMQVWPQDIEEALSQLQFPGEDIDLSLEEYCKLACTFLDIPIHQNNPHKNIIESLHVFFTLYCEFKANQHFQQNNLEDNYQQFQNPNNSME